MSCVRPLVAVLRYPFPVPRSFVPVRRSHFLWSCNARNCLLTSRAYGQQSRNCLRSCLTIRNSELAQQLVEILDDLAIELAILEATTKTQAFLAKIENIAITSAVALVVATARFVEATSVVAAEAAIAAAETSIETSIVARKADNLLMSSISVHAVATRLKKEAAAFSSMAMEKMAGANAEEAAATSASSMLRVEAAKIQSALSRIQGFAPEGSVSTKEVITLIQVVSALRTLVSLPSSYSPMIRASSALVVAEERYEKAAADIRDAIEAEVAAREKA